MTITDVRDRDEELGDEDVEMKERRKLKVIGFLLATAFMILVGAILRGTQAQPYYEDASTSLFEERSLQGLSGLCASRRNKDFEKVTFNSTTPSILVAQGATKKYQTTVPKGTIPAATATYPTGQVILSMSYVNEKPPPGEVEPRSGVECGNIGGTGAASNSADCSIRDETRDQTLFIWIDGMSETTVTFKVGAYVYVYP